jgi:hypothetical protein
MQLSKKILVINLLLLLFTTALFSNDVVPAKIIFYREYNYQGSLVTFRMYDKDSMLIRLKNNSYFVYQCTPGVHTLRMNEYRETNMQLNVEAGKTYYLRTAIRMGMWVGIPELILVDSLSAAPALKYGGMKQIMDNTPCVRPKSRIGLNVNVGGGFQNSDLFTLSNGDKSSLSFGGGYAFGVKYGYELNKKLDLSFDLNYQESELRPYLSDVKFAFERTVLSVTPAYIIPLDGGDAMRLKVGGGIDYYSGNSLTFETSKMPGGFDDTWQYNNALGYHFSVVWEMNPTENWSLNYGLKLYDVGYSFKSGLMSKPSGSSSNTFYNPSGSGIDLTCGFYYHF